MAATIRRIAVNTGGGDAPGLNAVIRAVALAGARRGWEVFGIRHGYLGLFREDGLIRLDADRVEGITNTGGTILGANNRGNPFRLTTEQGVIEDGSARLVERFSELGFDALVAIGGDGSLSIVKQLYDRYQFPVVGVPKTIDNDLDATEYTFGFDTAVSTATDALDKLQPTAQSHDRVMVVEVMGRYAGWIALHAGIAGTADVILLPEIPFTLESVSRKIMEREAAGRHYSIVVVAEGAAPLGGQILGKAQEAGRNVLLGGIAEQVAAEITAQTGKETRYLVLGHLQRGGPPTAFDRLLSLRFGAAAVRLIAAGDFGKMVALTDHGIRAVSLEEA
ncbi:MAG TPA: ATP-dependent 6-phosphofructokinase, partial [Candidatus Competibacteraceae bacterium]|nr:ATP-dependent 6-phosphofructokinase [Candidatus Competibacteraceae bacterium]